MKETPYFYHDLRARVIPGALFLAVFALQVQPPAAYSSWFANNDALKAVVMPFLLLGVSYALGDLIEVSLRPIWRSVGPRAFKKSLSEYDLAFQKSLHGSDSEASKKWRDWVLSLNSFQLWHWIVIRVGKEYPEAFVHCARFQSEAKMFFNASFPLSFLVHYVVAVRWAHPSLAWFAAIGSLVGCWRLSWSSEIRRWTQSIATGHQLNYPDELTQTSLANSAGAS